MYIYAMIQGILVSVIFMGAVAYLARLIYRQLNAKAACASACSKCSVVDFNKIEADLKGKGL